MFTGFCHFLPSLYPLFRPSLFQVVVNVSLPRSPYPMLRSISDGFRAQRRHIPPMQVRLHCDRKIAWQVPWQGIFMNTCWKLPMLRSDKQFPYISKLFPSLYHEWHEFYQPHGQTDITLPQHWEKRFAIVQAQGRWSWHWLAWYLRREGKVAAWRG